MPSPTPAAVPVSQESIFNLLPPPPPVPVKVPMHHSKYPATIPPTASTFGPSSASSHLITNVAGEFQLHNNTHSYIKPGALLGPKQPQPISPTNFLPAHTHAPLPEPKKFQY